MVREPIMYPAPPADPKSCMARQRGGCNLRLTNYVFCLAPCSMRPWPFLYLIILLSRLLYWIASATWSDLISGVSSRSAMVLEIFNILE